MSGSPAAILRAALTSVLHGPAVQATHAEHRCDVYAAGTCSTRSNVLCCSRTSNRPQPLQLIGRFNPRFCATLLPGRSTVPLALRVMARTSRASIGIVSKRRAIVDSGAGFFRPIFAGVSLAGPETRQRAYTVAFLNRENEVIDF